MAADYLTGKDGAVSIDSGPPVVLSIIEFRYRETSDVARGRAAGDRGTGRTHLATDWELNVRCRTTAAATTPNLLRRGADVAFVAKTDGAGSPAVTITGSGMNDETVLAVPAGDYVEFTMRIVCDSVAGADLPTLVPA